MTSDYSSGEEEAEERQRRYIIAVIGDGSADRRSAIYAIAEELGRALISAGYRVLTGGLGGVMEAASKGASLSPDYREGDIIAVLPGYDPAGANRYADICIATGLGVSRNAIVANSDAVIAVGGGAGTLSEIALAWSFGRPVIAFRTEGWSGKLADESPDEKIRHPDIEDDRIYGASSAEEAINILTERLPEYKKRNPGYSVR